MHSIFKRLFKKRPKEIFDFKQNDYIHYTLSGVNHNERPERILIHSIHEEVKLVREPQNEYDENAINVIGKNNESIGYLSKKDAEQLAKWLDSNEIEYKGYITNLALSPKKDTPLIEIVIPFKKGESRLKRLNYSQISYKIDKEDSETGKIYLNVICNENTYTELKRRLDDDDLANGLSGPYTPRNKSEITFDYYIQIKEGKQKEEELRKLIQEKFPNNYDLEDKETLEEWFKDLQEEKTNLTNEKNELEQEKEELKQIEKKYNSLIKSVNNFLGEASPNYEILNRNNKSIWEEDFNLHTLMIIQKINNKKISASDKVRAYTNNNKISNWQRIKYKTRKQWKGRVYFNKKTKKIYFCYKPANDIPSEALNIMERYNK